MEDRILEIASRVSTPLALAGLIVGALFLTLRQILSLKIFPQLTKQLSGMIIMKIINVFLLLAVLAVVFGFAGYAMQLYYPKLDREYVNIGTDRDQSLNEIVRVLSVGRNVTIHFSEKCEQIRYAIIEPGNHEGDNILDFLERLKNRVKGNAITYSVRKEGERRYEIVCQ